MAGVRSISGFGLAPQVVVGSAASAKSSGEHDISGISAVGVVTRGRVCATAEVNQRLRAKQATRTRANGFRSTINEELPFPLEFLLLFLIVRRAPLKDLGIVAVGARWFKRQCDCFVTKRVRQLFAT